MNEYLDKIVSIVHCSSPTCTIVRLRGVVGGTVAIHSSFDVHSHGTNVPSLRPSLEVVKD